MDISFNSISHFRELGGIKTKEGKTIKHGLFFRCGELTHVNDEELKKLNSLNIDTVFDLRSKGEQQAHKDIEGNYKVVCCPLALPERKSDSKYRNPVSFMDKILNADEAYYNYALYNFAKGYLEFAYNKKTISMIIDSLNKHETILFHCFGGKDRTGVVAMLIMAFLGCDYQTCKNDYLLHNEITKNEFVKYKEMLKMQNINEWGDKIATISFKAWDFLFDAAWYSVFDIYNSIEGYLADQFDVSEDQIEDWKNYYLE